MYCEEERAGKKGDDIVRVTTSFRRVFRDKPNTFTDPSKRDPRVTKLYENLPQ